MLSTIRTAIGLLDRRGRRQLWIVLSLMIVTALFEALGVGSVIPFISVLARPELVDTTPALRTFRDLLGLTDRRSVLIALGIVACGVFIATILANVLLTYVLQRYTWSKGQNLAERLFARQLGRPYVAFLGTHSGSLQALIFTEAQRVTSNAIYPSLLLAARGLAAGAIILLVVVYDPAVALTLGLMLTLAYGGMYLMLRGPAVRWGERAVRARARAQTIASEAFAGFAAIRAAGREPFYTDAMHAQTRMIARAEATGMFITLLPRFAIELVAFGTLFAVLLLRLAAGGDVSSLLPVAGAFAVAASRLLPAAQQIYWAATTLRGAEGSLAAVASGLAVTLDAPSVPASPWPGPGAMHLDGVRFRYPNAALPALGPIDLRIVPGDRIAIGGATGSGKSTLIGLLTGLIAPTDGHLLVDGAPLDGERRRHWSAALGIVQQQTFLAHGTVSDNVAFGLPVEPARLERALEAAQILDEMLGLPQGLATIIGESGHGLSGGQRQRLGLARALYREPALLVLDEPTSALDSATEEAVLAALAGLPATLTIVIVTHRPALLSLATRIITLEDGQVISEDNGPMSGQRNVAP